MNRIAPSMNRHPIPSAGVKRAAQSGFTLLEMTVVLVIIGLVIGGVLVGADLIRSAGIRATVSQIERYNSAVSTFDQKYNALPGDMNSLIATQFGFTPRGTGQAEGDGNGVIQGDECISGQSETSGETVAFWVDLTTANGLNVNLIDGGFNTASPIGTSRAAVTGADIANYVPQAKIGGGNYIYVWSGGINASPMYTGCSGALGDGINYYGLSAVTTLGSSKIGKSGSWTISNPGLTVAQAYGVDAKIDDGYPQSGTVTALYVNGGIAQWAGDSDPTSGGPVVAGDGVASTGSTTTCYDNAGVAGATEKYSLAQNGGAGVNCALSFQFVTQ